VAETSNKSDLRIYGRLLSYVVPYWGAFLLSIFGFLIYSISNVSFVQLISYIVDSLQTGGAEPNPEIGRYLGEYLGEGSALDRTLIPIAIIIIAVSRGFGTFVGNYFISYVSNYLVHNLRCELFDRLLTLPSAFYDKHAMGHLVAKVTFHVTQVTGAATDAVRVIIREGFTVIGYLALLLYLNWKLTLIFFAVAPVIAVLVGYAGKRFRRISERIQNSMGDVTHVASEAVQGYREVRTFGGRAYESDRFDKVSQDNRRQSMKMVVTSSIATPTIQLMVAVALAGLVWLVLDPLLLSDMTPGNVVAFITTSGLLAKPIRQLSEVVATIQKGLAAAEDIFDLFDEELEKDEGSFEVERVAGKIEFRNVRFAYSPDTEDVLDDISFTVNPGETVALVGRSGSGKSTLVSLIPRFYAPVSGEILIDGKSVDSFALQNLRQHIAIVSQQVTLFNDTVARNIGYGSLQEAESSELREAAEKAYAWNFIESLESGLDTVVGDDGVLLSGGQRQRLAIARAFLKDAPILILDEATSALDTESERYIQKALEAVVKGRTTFIIAHRLSTIENADRIFVIDHGRIVEEGTHRELLTKQGFYAQLHVRDEIAGDADSDDNVPAIMGGEYPLNKYPGAMNASTLLVDAWYNDVFWIRMFTPLSWLYEKAVLYRRRWLTSRAVWKPSVPLIIVGNISAGGTGKSPLVIGLVNYLKSLGLKPGVVSRGYGGKSSHYPVEVCATSHPAEVGDEPVMIYNRTRCPVVVDPDRVEATRSLIENHDCDVVVSDDGLQHYALGRDIEIAVIDGERGLGNELCFPAGPLREPVSRLKEVDLVVVNGDRSRVSHLSSGPCMEMQLNPTRLVNIKTGSVETLESVKGKTVHAVVGISNPERFFSTLKKLGCTLVPHQYPDHHPFTAADINFDDELPVIMTEKDAVKLDPLTLDDGCDQFWYLEVEATFTSSELDRLLQRLELSPVQSGA
jgi:ATP-binding cassette, subfamily B, bacterial MsbA